MMKSRKERKLEAKQNGAPFVPQYNGNGVISAEDFYGTGVERFNNKFVKFNEKVEEVVITAEPVQVKEEKVELIEPELVKEAPKKKKNGKFKKAMKKLFNK
ncbi:hypothetical protein [Lysinibacillus sp. Bpr_S20]|uniref:hypothetical protein n=1 Tax=Lysinibacillus sp. Bpr_S20 TaxID=2933964 RepID=UPI00201135AE|nr:hypothetical protein [Lysinibacillus sp. Bpr_S20]MCL1700695.1 hypothetical protein [Lysinibacillus sp. Bpr_S20]